ncbi:MAG: DUF2096 domain-containing protein [Nitrososphaerota archaeon]|jgi:hypothetical protein|nr:DUF2096 domain-containing protein [Nitrososphaerota archaeon]
MGNALAVWRVLEELLVALRKVDVQVPVNVVDDLRVARSLIDLSYSVDVSERVVANVDAYLVNVEAYLMGQVQEVFELNVVDGWFKRLETATLDAIDREVLDVVENRFVVGVPRDKKWIRIELSSVLSEMYVSKLARECNLNVIKHVDGHLVVFGLLCDIKMFVKRLTVK